MEVDQLVWNFPSSWHLLWQKNYEVDFLQLPRFCLIVFTKMRPYFLPESINRLAFGERDVSVKSSSLKLWMPQIETLFSKPKNSSNLGNNFRMNIFWGTSSIMILLKGMYLIYKN